MSRRHRAPVGQAHLAEFDAGDLTAKGVRHAVERTCLAYGYDFASTMTQVAGESERPELLVDVELARPDVVAVTGPPSSSLGSDEGTPSPAALADPHDQAQLSTEAAGGAEEDTLVVPDWRLEPGAGDLGAGDGPGPDRAAAGTSRPRRRRGWLLGLTAGLVLLAVAGAGTACLFLARGPDSSTQDLTQLRPPG